MAMEKLVKADIELFNSSLDIIKESMYNKARFMHPS